MRRIAKEELVSFASTLGLKQNRIDTVAGAGSDYFALLIKLVAEKADILPFGRYAHLARSRR